jgi:hypothetical protein
VGQETHSPDVEDPQHCVLWILKIKLGEHGFHSPLVLSKFCKLLAKPDQEKTSPYRAGVAEPSLKIWDKYFEQKIGTDRKGFL